MKMRVGAPRAVLLFVFAALVPVGVAACGSDDSSDESQSLLFIASAQGDGVAVTGPSTAEAGEAEISLNNESEKDADLQLIRVEGDQSADEAAEGIAGAVRGAPLPDWFFAAGGVGPTEPGQSRTVTQVLEPGTYYAFDTSGPKPAGDLAAELVVSGDQSDESLEADATISAFEYNFETVGLKTGENEVLFENTGAQPHHVIYAPIVGDATAADIEKSFKENKGPPPIDLKNEGGTAVLDGGDRQLVELDFAKPGRYALLCFISDRQGGPPHAFKGMIKEVEVE